MGRRILRVNGGQISVATEARFALEADLHAAVAAHPDVLPSEDLGLGPLVTLCQELDFGHGPLDLLAVDASGRLAVIEFKRGTENPDVRKVIAQLLDYGAALWRQSIDSLTQQINKTIFPLNGTLTDHVALRLEALGVPFDPDLFLQGLEASLERGDFVFLYVARDLDERTKKVMTYLAEGPRMTFFAVEVDNFVAGDGTAVMVPRTAFVPSWIATGTSAATSRPAVSLDEVIAGASAETVELLRRLEDVARTLDLHVDNTRAARQFRPARGVAGISVFPADGKIYWDIGTFRQHGLDEVADRFRERLSAIAGKQVAPEWPGVACEAVLAAGDVAQKKVVEDYFAERRQIPGQRPS